MIEIEENVYSKSFMDKLAIGIDSIYGTLILDDEIVFNPRLSKCFLYVEDSSPRIIENLFTLAKMYKTNEWIVIPNVLRESNAQRFISDNILKL